jgi:hypothetical protein
MKQHDVDVVSLAAGLLFVSLAVVFALHELDVFSLDVRVVPAVVLIVLGLAGISGGLTARRAAERDRPTSQHPTSERESASEF